MPSVSFPSHTCSWCQNLVIQNKSENAPDNEPFVKQNSSSDKIIFNCTFKDVKAGAAQGCKLCEWILNAEAISRYAYLDADMAREDMDMGTYEAICLGFDTEVTFHRSSLLEAASEAGDGVDDCILVAATEPPFRNSVGYMPDVQRIAYFGLWDSVNEKIACLTRRDLQCFVEPNDAAAKEFTTRSIESDMMLSLPNMRSWLKECHLSHEKCSDMATSIARSGMKPARLLHIDSSKGQPRVHIQDTATLSQLPPYIALSYCWGGDQPVKCTTDTLASFSTSIPFASLPKTLQDVIKVCSDLGYEYLWIDALCILQNSHSEKATEIAKMPLIYGQAVVTIAASRSASVGDGFLHPRIEDAKNCPAFQLPCVCSNGEKGAINLVDLDTQAEPIDTRGWTLQERLLSPRIIEFGSRQTRWTCQDDAFSDGITDGWRREVEAGALKPKATALRASVSKADQRMGLWAHLVEIYTARRLTQGMDRPLAISGIAEWFSTLFDDEYLAGLWKSQIHACLLWSVLPKDRTSRPKSFQGPSWSWLSIEGPIHFRYIYYKVWSTENLKITLLSYEITLATDSARFGAVREGSCSLKVQGKLANVEVSKTEDNELYQWDHTVRIFGKNKAGDCNGLADFYPDCEEVVQSLKGGCKGDVMALEILNMREGSVWSSYGIVLRRIENTKRRIPSFQRLGCYVFEIDDENCQQDEETDEEWEERIQLELDWFLKLEATTIELV